MKNQDFIVLDPMGCELPVASKGHCLIEAPCKIPGVLNNAKLFNDETKTDEIKIEWSKFQVTEFEYTDTKNYCDEAMSVLVTQNAGGSSELSECISMQILYDQFEARGVTTEMEIKYWSDHWKRCDYVTRLGNNKYKTAVSVTRVAMRKNKLGQALVKFNGQMAIQLFAKKLHGLVVARTGIMTEDDGFDNSILHILCREKRDVEILRHVYNILHPDLQADIQVLVTLVKGDDNKVSSIF